MNLKEYFTGVLFLIIGTIIFIAPPLLSMFIVMQLTKSDFLQLATPIVVSILYVPFAYMAVVWLMDKMDLK